MIDAILTLTLSDWGSWASLFGLLVALVTLVSVFRIKRKFLFRSSIDAHIKNINHISSEISALLVSYADNKSYIEEYFALANVELRAMEKGASEDLLADIKAARKSIRRYGSSVIFWVEKNEDSARRIKTGLSVVAAELDNHRRSLLVGN